MFEIRNERVNGSDFKLTATVDGMYAGKLEYILSVFNAETSVITDLEVVEKFRRKGIATELLETAIERIFTRNYMTTIVIQDGSENGATKKIVERLGFKQYNSYQNTMGWYELRRLV